MLFLWNREYLKGEPETPNPVPGTRSDPVKLTGSEGESTSAASRKCRPGTADTLELATSSDVQLRVSGALAGNA